MKTSLLFSVSALFLLAGCQSLGYGNMTPEQIAAAVKDKNAACISIVSNAGVAKIVVVDLTKGQDVIINAETCNIATATHDVQPKPAPASQTVR